MKIIKYVLPALLALVLPLHSFSHQAAQPKTAPTPPAHSAKRTPSAAPSSQEIESAKAKNLVWVNTSTRVYHTSSSTLYGTTKHGKFMTEEDAKKAGYRVGQETGRSKTQPVPSKTPK